MTNRVAFIAAFCAFCAPAGAWAQSTAAQETSVPGGTLVLVAYFCFVAVMMGYLAVLNWRQRKLDQDIVALEKRLDELAELR